MKAHLKDVEEPLIKGATITANCGKEIPNAHFVFVADEQDEHELDAPEGFSALRNLCHECQIPAWKTRMRYGLISGQEAMSSEEATNG